MRAISLSYSCYFTLFATLILLLDGCKKEEINEDWATSISGTYKGKTINQKNDTLASTTIITRVNDKLINVQLSLPPGYGTFCIDGIELSSPSTLLISGSNDKCFGISNNYAGNGSIDGNNISYFVDYIGFPGTLYLSTTASK